MNPKVLPIYIPGFSELIVLPRLLPWGHLSVLDKGEENKAICFLTDNRQEKHGWVRISTGPRLKELVWSKGNWIGISLRNTSKNRYVNELKEIGFLQSLIALQTGLNR